MAHKDDNENSFRRNRVKYACNPDVESLFVLVNMFPPLADMKEVSAPTRPMTGLFRNFTFDETKEAAKLKEKTLEYYKEIFGVGVKMFYDLVDKGLEQVLEIFKFSHDLEKIRQAEIEWQSKITEFDDFKQKALKFPDKITIAESKG